MKIVVAIDSSIFADAILEELVSRPLPSGTSIRLITVIETTAHWETDQQLLRQAECILLERTKSLKKHLPAHVACASEVIEGQAASMINATAKEWNADLIIIGSHGDTGPRRLGIGSVAAAVVNMAPCSVEVIKIMDTSSRGASYSKAHCATA